MKRHAKRLQKKARKNTIIDHRGGVWFVESSTSGETHHVVEGGGRLWCDCDWAQYHPAEPCSHRMTVTDELADREGWAVYYWTSEEDAKRQHKQTLQIGEGLWVTIEK